MLAGHRILQNLQLNLEGPTRVPGHLDNTEARPPAEERILHIRALAALARAPAAAAAAAARAPDIHHRHRKHVRVLHADANAGLRTAIMRCDALHELLQRPPHAQGEAVCACRPLVSARAVTPHQCLAEGMAWNATVQ